MTRFISLFAGVGGFDLGMERAGHECVAQVEWDGNAAGVLKRRWPDVPLFCDVSKVSADDLPDADFITYGFPCQDLSVAGKREGLNGQRSGLFYEATRLIRELRSRGCGLRIAVAENVAGLFSADDGVALARCIRELLDCGACETGWRLLDSQYFGVAQRRKRVFIVSDFGGESVDEILAITESLPGHPAPSREAGQGTAGDAGAGFTASSFGGHERGCGTLRSQGGDLGGGSETLAVAQGADVYNGELTGETAVTVTSATGIANASGPKGIEGPCYSHHGQDSRVKNCGETSPTLHSKMDNVSDIPLICDASGPKVIEQKETYCLQGGGETSQSSQGSGVNKDVASTLNGLDKHGVAYEQEGIAFEPRSADGEPRITGDIKKVVSPTLNCMGGGQREPSVCSWNGDVTPKASEDVSVTLRSQQGGEGVGVALSTPWDTQRARIMDKSGVAPTLQSGAKDSGNITPAVTQNLTVRRLTPVECERLQGFPDGWTSEKMEVVLEGNEWKATGKVVKQADGPRYKAMGNAVTVNVAEWLGKRIGGIFL